MLLLLLLNINIINSNLKLTILLYIKMATLFTITKIMGVYGKGKNRAVLEVDEMACLFGADLWDMVKGYGGLRGASPTAALIKAYIKESEFDEYWHGTLWRHRVKRSDDWELEMSGYGEDKYDATSALELMISLEYNMKNECCGHKCIIDGMQRRLKALCAYIL